ncbi:MAG: hypothetical protein IKK34_06865 [Clostridia bacterium]|nr:hypothetical protein [Clostridia bacterium]
MRRLMAFGAASLLLFSTAAADIDLSGMTYADLVSLKDQLNLAMWESQDWQEVIVPNGTWKIGEDIPAGYWTISSRSDRYNTIIYSNEMGDNGVDLDWVLAPKAIHATICGPDHWMYNSSMDRYVSIDCKEGFWIQISGGAVQFTPYSGKPSFSFK